jgi:uncharacterized SAM-binding protein YcdF (DUF218 family)
MKIFLSKLISAFVIPPGCFVIALLFLFFFVPRRFKGVMLFAALLFYAMSIQPVSDALLKPLENAYPPITAAEAVASPPQAIVVLGAGSIIGSPEAGEKEDTLSADAVKRALYAFTLRNKYLVPIVFSGGKVFDYEQETEAAVAKRLYESLGLPARRFVAEGESRNTWENAQETAKLKYKTVILVSSAYHMKRAIYCFEKNGMTVIPAPTDYKTDRGRKYDVLSYMPSNIYFRNTCLAFHEYVGLLYYVVAYRK